MTNHYICDQGRSETGTGSDAGENPAIRDATLLSRDPLCHKLIGSGINDGFSGAEQKADCDQDPERSCDSSRNGGRDRSEYTPPEHTGGKHASWTEAVGQVAADHLEQGVSGKKSAEHPTELDV